MRWIALSNFWTTGAWLLICLSACFVYMYVIFFTLCHKVSDTQDVYQLDPFLLREIFYSLLLDWVQIWMRKLHHDIHVMNTRLAIYDADSRCLYMQIETVSTCCWDGHNLGYKRPTLLWLSHLDIYHADGKWKMLIFFSLFFILGLCTSTLIL